MPTMMFEEGGRKVTLKVLLVGIEASVCALIREALEGRGHQVVELAVWEAERVSVEPQGADVVICEVHDVDAEQPLRALKNLQRPVIAISRHPDMWSRYQHTVQPWAYLTNPMRITHLADLAEEAGGGGR